MQTHRQHLRPPPPSPWHSRLKSEALSCVAIFIAAAPLAHAGVLQNTRGNPYREIIISAQAPPMVRLAAKEMQTFIRKTCKATIPIVTDRETSGTPPYILIGQSELTDRLNLDSQGLKKEGFKIVSTPDYLAILGRDHQGGPITLERDPWTKREVWNETLGLCAFGEAGTLYGVYRFLEDHLGVRWYWPNKYGTVIQPSEKVTIPEFEITDAPKVNYRYPWYCMAQRAPDHFLWLRRARFGGTVPVYIIHSFNRFQKHKESHPEYFALVDGKRDFRKLCCIGGGGHLCLTNPEVIRQWVREIGQYFRDNPEHLIFPLVPMDGLTRVCGCPACQAEVDLDYPGTGRFSNHIWGFVNKVATEVAKTHPDKIIGCLGYEQYQDPPSRIPHLSPNVAVMLCYGRMWNAIPGRRKRVYQRLEQWKDRTSHIYTWNWYLQHWKGRPWHGVPLCTTQLIKDDYAFLDSLKVWKGEFIQANQPPRRTVRMLSPATQHINLYLSGRAMWNPDFNLRETMDEYYRLFYGPAEQEIRQFWQLSEKSLLQAATQTDEPNGRLRPEDAYSTDVLAQLNSCLARALLKTPEGSEYRQRVLQIRKEFAPATQLLSQLHAKGNRTMEVEHVNTITALKARPLQRFMNKDGTAPSQQTQFSIGWNADNLLLTFHCAEPDMKALSARCTKPDSNDIFNDDNIEIFLCPDIRQPQHSFQLCVNAAGTVWDGRYGFGIRISKSWNCKGIRTHVLREAERWTVEVEIPAASLDLREIVAGQSFLANFYRTRIANGTKAYSCWSPTFSARHFTPSRFGHMTCVQTK